MKTNRTLIGVLIASLLLNSVLFWRLRHVPPPATIDDSFELPKPGTQPSSSAALPIVTEMKQIADRNAGLKLSGMSMRDLSALSSKLYQENRPIEARDVSKLAILTGVAQLQEAADKQKAELTAIEARHPNQRLQDMTDEELQKTAQAESSTNQNWMEYFKYSMGRNTLSMLQSSLTNMTNNLSQMR